MTTQNATFALTLLHILDTSSGWMLRRLPNRKDLRYGFVRCLTAGMKSEFLQVCKREPSFKLQKGHT
jgi:hypothetical protein